MNVIICNNAVNLRKALRLHIATATVEAEYGNDTVEGTMFTLAHHGKNAENPAPCEMNNITIPVSGTVPT